MNDVYLITVTKGPFRAERWKDRARTYGGIADALATHIENRLDPWA